MAERKREWENERRRENLPSITSIHGKNGERERDCENKKEREGGTPLSFIQCQGLDSPPVIRLFHCAERSGWGRGIGLVGCVCVSVSVCMVTFKMLCFG